MDKLVVTGGNKLVGEIEISGSKNATLPIMCASLLLKNDSLILSNVPNLVDIKTLGLLLENLGVTSDKKNTTLKLTTKTITGFEASYDMVRKMRASVLVMGPLLAVKRKVRVSLPGGCAIGARPINLHMEALTQMGAKLKLNAGYIEGHAPNGLKGTTIHFSKISVGATENIMLAAVLAKGTTTICNAAMEPEISDLASLLIKMGAKIEGAGTPTIKIHGVKELHGTNHSVIPDRIEAGTFLVAACAAGGNVKILNCIPEHVSALIEKLKEAGAKIKIGENSIHIVSPKIIKSVDIATSEFPGFPTDLQAQFMVLNMLGNGISIVSENIFENRFMHINELMRMGANIRIEKSTAIISGKTKLIGAAVMATDLRASASLVIAALVAKGTSEILRIYHLDRGYENLELKLKKLGANIKRTKGKAY